jgi:hypothetical protein
LEAVLLCRSDLRIPLLGDRAGRRHGWARARRGVDPGIDAAAAAVAKDPDRGISFKTAVTHRASIMSKLDVHEIASVVREAIRRGLV